MKDFYEEVPGVKDYWLRFEWQHSVEGALMYMVLFGSVMLYL